MGRDHLPGANILIVEDNRGDRRLLLEAFQEQETAVRLHFAQSAPEALLFLEPSSLSPDAPVPDLILLDLNLAGKDGRTLLGELKASARFRRIPVIVLSTSDAVEDVDLCYDLHANCFLTKPWGLAEYAEMVKCLVQFWLGAVSLPGKSDSITAREACRETSPRDSRAFRG